ncbi:MAG: NAD(P)H-dependent flavin oxidoreductase [Hyphomonadaceae bacterium]
MGALQDLLGVKYPIVQAPMGLIATADFASHVSNAGALGLVGVGLGSAAHLREELSKMRALTAKPFGVNVALAFLQDPAAIDIIVEHGVRFVTTSAGDPARFTPTLKAAGITVYHVVPNLKAALKAVDAGVDGLVVEGGEGGGFKNPDLVSTMVLIPLIRDHVAVPIVAAGGICDGRGIAAAFALGADAIQMGTRFVCSEEAPVHRNWKEAIVAAGETDTVVLKPNARQAVRTMKTQRTLRLEAAGPFDLGSELSQAEALYYRGDMEGGIALLGQVCGRIRAIKPVAAIVEDLMAEYHAAMADLARRTAP